MKLSEECFKKVKKDCFKFIKSQETKTEKFSNKDKMLKTFLIPMCFWIANKTNNNQSFNNLIESSQNIFSNKSYFFCNSCGYKSSILNWLCPKCNTWNEVVPKTNIDIIEENSFNA